MSPSGRERSSAKSAAQMLSGPAAGGILSEVWADGSRDGGAALGFALDRARGLLSASRPVVLVLQLCQQAQDSGLPCGTGLRAFGFDPQALIMGQVQRTSELLWAAEEALGCKAVAAIIADVTGAPRELDFTTSRRLALRARRSGGTVFVVRYGRERTASAAACRWHVRAAPSAAAGFDRRAPGAARLMVRLEKGAGAASGSWLLEWTHNGFKRVGDETRDAGAGAAAAHGAHPAVLADRLSEAG